VNVKDPWSRTWQDLALDAQRTVVQAARLGMGGSLSAAEARAALVWARGVLDAGFHSDRRSERLLSAVLRGDAWLRVDEAGRVEVITGVEAAA
jgi:hypothetical protein